MRHTLLGYGGKTIEYGFYALAFLVPLFFTQLTFELFEFPKMILVYFLTILISAAWAIKAVITKKLNFPRTPLDRPIMALLGVNILAAFFSLDRYTSIYGYYTRFNGGLLSLLAYITLYYIFVGEMRETRRKNRFISLLLLSSFLVAFYGILQHFGIDKDFWVQDVQRRVFSTLGQPNWLAAFLLMTIPVSLEQQISNFRLQISKLPYVILPIVLYAAFWFTYSRSGLLGFGAMLVTFVLLAGKKNLRRGLVPLGLTAIAWIVISALTFTPTISGKIRETTEGAATNRAASPQQESTAAAKPATQPPAQPSGSTVKIRLAVWKGTLSLIKDNPLLGTGPETFAYAFLPYRSAELNQTAEWNFLYNKAHNEYLNIAATTGLLGLAAYLWLIAQFTRLQRREFMRISEIGIFAGWLGLLVSNFFGFGVVVTSLLFWLYMALNVATSRQGVSDKNDG